MIGYVTLGSNDFEKAKAFYDAVLAPLGAERTMSGETMQGYGGPGEGPMLGVCKPYDGKPASGGNGTMVALAAKSRAIVDTVHAAALAAQASTPSARTCASSALAAISRQAHPSPAGRAAARPRAW